MAEAKYSLYNNCISTSKTCRLSNHSECRSAAAVVVAVAVAAAAASTLFVHLETSRASFEFVCGRLELGSKHETLGKPSTPAHF